MNDKQRQQLSVYVDEADNASSEALLSRWMGKVSEFLKQSYGPDGATYFERLKNPNVYDEVALKVGHLEGLLAKDEGNQIADARNSPGQGPQEEISTTPNGRRVFVVHGHDGEVKESVARFLEKLGLDPIILHEQPNQGRTIIEKFEVSSADIAFAVVLLTPDDVGSAASQPLGNLCAGS